MRGKGIFCEGSEDLSMTEQEQSEDKEPHRGKEYGVRVYHHGSHPNIMKCKECWIATRAEFIQEVADDEQRQSGDSIPK